MYKIIGADQREYGPVTVDQVRQWISEGRANGATLVQAEGATEWTPLSSLPEFADALSAQAQAQAQAQPQPQAQPDTPAALFPAEPADPEGLASAIRARDYRIDIGQCLTRSWELFRENFGVLIGATLIAGFLMLGVNQLVALFTRDAMQSLMNGNVSPGPILTIVLWNIPEVAFSTVLWAGLYFMLFKLVRGDTAGLGDVFSGFQRNLPQLAIAGVVMQFLTVLGVLACVLPGIYLSVAWLFTVPLIVDRGFSFWSAMEVSRKVITQHWWMMFCLFLVVALLNLVGLAACCVGLLVAVPVGLGALIYAYEDIFRGGAPSGT